MRKLLHSAVALLGIATIGAVGSPARATVSATTNSPGTTDLAEGTTTGVDVINTETIEATITVIVTFSGFTQPLGGTFSDMLTASLVTTDPVGDSISLVSCATASPGTCTGAIATLPTLTFLLTPTSVSDSAFVDVNSLPSPYRLVQVITITLAPGDGADFTAETQVSTVPEPMSAALLASGLVGVGWLRRRAPRRTT